MRATIGIDIAASPEQVFRLARDVERWPRLLPHYVAVQVLRRGDDGSLIARFVARRELVPVIGLGLPIAWRSRTWGEPASRRLRFIHQGGATNGMDVTWRVEPAPGGSRVTIEHLFQPRIRPWAFIVDRLFIRPIAGRTLATFKAIAEALSEESVEAPPEGPPAEPGNPEGSP